MAVLLPNRRLYALRRERLVFRFYAYNTQVRFKYILKNLYSRLPLIQSSRGPKKTCNRKKAGKPAALLAVKWNRNHGLTQKEICHISVAFFSFLKIALLKASSVNVYGCLFALFSLAKKCSEEKTSVCIGRTCLQFAVSEFFNTLQVYWQYMQLARMQVPSNATIMRGRNDRHHC